MGNRGGLLIVAFAVACGCAGPGASQDAEDDTSPSTGTVSLGSADGEGAATLSDSSHGPVSSSSPTQSGGSESVGDGTEGDDGGSWQPEWCGFTEACAPEFESTVLFRGSGTEVTDIAFSGDDLYVCAVSEAFDRVELHVLGADAEGGNVGPRTDDRRRGRVPTRDVPRRKTRLRRAVGDVRTGNYALRGWREARYDLDSAAPARDGVLHRRRGMDRQRRVSERAREHNVWWVACSST